MDKLRIILTRWGFSWQGIINNKKGEWWLFAQILLIAAHLIPQWPSQDALNFVWPPLLLLLGIGLIIRGIFLATMSVIKLGSSLTPLPSPMDGSLLKIEGPYKYSRHPLYKSIILISLGQTIALGSLIHCLLLFTLATLLIYKAKTEEKELIKLHSRYQDYMENTPAIFKGLSKLDWRS